MDMHRLRTEREGLERLKAAYPDVIAFSVAPNLRRYDVRLRVPAPVGTDEQYTVEQEHTLVVLLPDGFPAQRPILQFDRPILSPNIWPDGDPCILDQWFPAQHLDQLVCAVIQEMQGIDPNYGSIANEAAAALYQRPGFVSELRRRLGPPLLIAPPAAASAPPASRITTAPSTGRSGRSGIQTASVRGATPRPTHPITTVR